MKKLVATILVLVLSMALVCSAYAADITIGYASKSSSSPFWVENIKGAEAKAKELGITLKVIGPPVENDVAGQVNVIEDMIGSGCDAIVVAPCGDVVVADVVNKALDQKIPVVAVDNAIMGADVPLVATDNHAAGEMAAAFIAESVGGKGKVIIVNGIIAQGSGKGRRDGFVEHMNANFPEIEVVEVVGDWDDQKALSGFEAAYAANSDVVGGYAAWDGATLQMYQVLKTNGRDDVVLCGFDAYDAAVKLMYNNDSLFKGDIAQNPANMGATAVQAAYDMLNGKEVERYIDTGTTLITNENVEEYANTMGVKVK